MSKQPDESLDPPVAPSVNPAVDPPAEPAAGAPSIRISSTSVCGTPSASIMCLTLASGAQTASKARWRRAGGKKSFRPA